MTDPKGKRMTAEELHNIEALARSCGPMGEDIRAVSDTEVKALLSHIASLEAEIKSLREERDGFEADYLRRHKDACDLKDQVLALTRPHSDEEAGKALAVGTLLETFRAAAVAALPCSDSRRDGAGIRAIIDQHVQPLLSRLSRQLSEAREKADALDALVRMVPPRPNAITYEHGWKILDAIQAIADARALSTHKTKKPGATGRPQIGHKSGCVTINCPGCGTDFYSEDHSPRR